jgi:hypothetical protein
MELDLPNEPEKDIEPSARKRKQALEMEKALIVQWLQNGCNVAKAARAVGMKTSLAYSVLDPIHIDKTPELRKFIDDFYGSSEIKAEWVINLLKQEATQPHHGDPQARAQNIRSIELLAKIAGLFVEKKQVEVSVVHQMTALIQKARELHSAKKTEIIDAESRPILPSPESDPLRDQNHSDGRE